MNVKTIVDRHSKVLTGRSARVAALERRVREVEVSFIVMLINRWIWQGME